MHTYIQDDDEEETDRVLANVIGNTTCRVDSYNNSCYFTITSSPVYIKFLEAFVSHLQITCVTYIRNYSTA